MRALAAEPTEETSKETAPKMPKENARPYPAFFKAIKDINKEVEELVKEGESLYNDEKKNIQDPNKGEILTDFLDFLRSTRQYWKIAVETVNKLPAKTPWLLTLIADPKEFFNKKKEEDLASPPRLNEESKIKRDKAIKDLAKTFKSELSRSGKSIPKQMDVADVQDYIKSLSNYIVKYDTSLLSAKDDLNELANLIEEVSVELLGEERAENLSSTIREVVREKSKESKVARFRGLCKIAGQESWTAWKQKVEEIKQKIEALNPLYRDLSEAWTPEKYSKNRKMLRNFFVGKASDSGLRFYGQKVLGPSVEIYLDRIYGKEETPEEQQQNDATLQQSEIENQRALWESEVAKLKEEQISVAEEVIGRLREKKSKSSSKKELDVVEKRIENITKDMHQKLDEVLRDKRSGAEEQQRKDMEIASKELMDQLQVIGKELEEIHKKEESLQQDEKDQENQAVASNFRSLSVYAEDSSFFKPFVFILNKFKELKNKVNEWMGSGSEKKKEESEVEVEIEEEVVKKKLAEVYQEYKQKIVEGVKEQIRVMKEAGSSNPELTAKISPLFDRFIEALPKALDEQLSKYQKALNLLMGGNKAIQETFKVDAEKIIQELFETHVTTNLKTAFSKTFRRLGADTLLAPNDKVLSERVQNIQKDVAKINDSKQQGTEDVTVKNPTQKEEDKEGGMPELDKKALDKILVDSFKATIDNNKEEVEALLSKSEK